MRCKTYVQRGTLALKSDAVLLGEVNEFLWVFLNLKKKTRLKD